LYEVRSRLPVFAFERDGVRSVIVEADRAELFGLGKHHGELSKRLELERVVACALVRLAILHREGLKVCTVGGSDMSHLRLKMAPFTSTLPASSNAPVVSEMSTTSMVDASDVVTPQWGAGGVFDPSSVV
jgi:hypothetical protein